jgi:DNA-binding response OmpR family regulator
MARGFESREAVSRARAAGYDAVVLDARLPGEDGFEVCRRLRGEHLNQPVSCSCATPGDHQ